MYWFLIIVLIVALDQVTKFAIESSIEFGGAIPVIDNFFYIAHWKNTGAAWGIFQDGKALLIPLTMIISLVLVYYLYKGENKIMRLSLSFIIGGAAGNLIDRIWRTGVVDFFEFHFGSYQFPIFNVADTFVVIGTAILAYYMLFIYKEKDTNPSSEKLRGNDGYNEP